jgi:hypothetical protein
MSIGVAAQLPQYERRGPVDAPSDECRGSGARNRYVIVRNASLKKAFG